MDKVIIGTEGVDLLTRMTRDLRVKMTLLDECYQPIEIIEGVATSGSITISAASNYRRTGQMALQILNPIELLPAPKSKLWFGKRVKVEVGLADELMNKIEWFNMGIFSILNCHFKLSPTEKNVSISLGDNMCYLNGDLGGRIDTDTTVLPNKSNITQAIVAAVKEAKVQRIMPEMISVDGHPAVVPVEISQAPNSTLADLISQLVNLYRGYEFFFDKDGYFRVQKIKNTEKDTLVWDFTGDKDLKISINNSLDFTNVKNSVSVWGRILDNGKQIYWRYRNRFLRHSMKRYVHADYDEFEFPYIHDQEIGDICHLNEIFKADEFYRDDMNQPMCTHIKTDRLLDFYRGREKSYVWTRHNSRKEQFRTNVDSQVRLTAYAADEYDIIVKSIDHPDDELIAVRDMTKICLGERDSRWFTIKKINPTPIEGEVLTKKPDEDGSVYVFKKLIYNPEDVRIFVDGKEIHNAKVTNRADKGIVFFDFIPKGTVKAYYLTYTPNGILYPYKDISITYTYEMFKPMWMELDFFVVPKFNMENLGEKIQSTRDEKVYTMNQAMLNSEYGLFNASNFAETVNIESAPIYLDCNRKIKVSEPDIGVEGEYLINDLNYSLGVNGRMNLTASKIYNPLINYIIKRNSPPMAMPGCQETSVLYPDTITKGYWYDFAKQEYILKDLISIPSKIYLDLSEIDELEKFANSIPFEVEADKQVFVAKAKVIYEMSVFADEMTKNAFIKTMTANSKIVLKAVREAPKLTYTTGEAPKLVHYNCHYVGKNSGEIVADYDLGKGNTFEYLDIREKEKPPSDYLHRYTITDCDYIYNNWPLKEYYLPPRPFRNQPKVWTDNPPTQNFVRKSGELKMDYQYYPYEPYVQTKVVSHFCANILDSSWDAIRFGDMPKPTKDTPYPIKHEEMVHLGAVRGDFPINMALSMGNTAEKLEIYYENEVIYTTVNEPDSIEGFYHKPTKKSIKINWQPKEGKYDVVFKITMTKKEVPKLDGTI